MPFLLQKSLMEGTENPLLCLNFGIETKIKTLFLILYFNLSKKQNGSLGVRTVDTRKGSMKKAFLTTLQNSQEDICVGVSFAKKLQAGGLQLH